MSVNHVTSTRDHHQRIIGAAGSIAAATTTMMATTRAQYDWTAGYAIAMMTARARQQKSTGSGFVYLDDDRTTMAATAAKVTGKERNRNGIVDASMSPGVDPLLMSLTSHRDGLPVTSARRRGDAVSPPSAMAMDNPIWRRLLEYHLRLADDHQQLGPYDLSMKSVYYTAKW